VVSSSGDGPAGVLGSGVVTPWPEETPAPAAGTPAVTAPEAPAMIGMITGDVPGPGEDGTGGSANVPGVAGGGSSRAHQAMPPRRSSASSAPMTSRRHAARRAARGPGPPETCVSTAASAR
jgi:hypothetical protein